MEDAANEQDAAMEPSTDVTITNDPEILQQTTASTPPNPNLDPMDPATASTPSPSLDQEQESIGAEQELPALPDEGTPEVNGKAQRVEIPDSEIDEEVFSPVKGGEVVEMEGRDGEERDASEGDGEKAVGVGIGGLVKEERGARGEGEEMIGNTSNAEDMDDVITGLDGERRDLLDVGSGAELLERRGVEGEKESDHRVLEMDGVKVGEGTGMEASESGNVIVVEDSAQISGTLQDEEDVPTVEEVAIQQEKAPPPEVVSSSSTLPESVTQLSASAAPTDTEETQPEVVSTSNEAAAEGEPSSVDNTTQELPVSIPEELFRTSSTDGKTSTAENKAENPPTELPSSPPKPTPSVHTKRKVGITPNTSFTAPEGSASQNKDVLMAELKAMKIVSRHFPLGFCFWQYFGLGLI
jgi:hypothetical protein